MGFRTAGGLVNVQEYGEDLDYAEIGTRRGLNNYNFGGRIK